MDPSVLHALTSVAVALLTIWVLLVVALLVAMPGRGALREAVRLLPDLLRLLPRLARDRTVPRSVRGWLWATLGYLAIPIDLVPDFIPVLGYADDAVVVAAVLRLVIRRAGAEAVRRHWPGTPDGLAALMRLAGTSARASGASPDASSTPGSKARGRGPSGHRRRTRRRTRRRPPRRATRRGGPRRGRRRTLCGVRVQPLTPEGVVDHVVAHVLAAAGEQPPGARLRVAVDGAPAARPAELADALVAPLRAAGRPVIRVGAGDFLRPASLRLEHGREDPDAFFDRWLDVPALARELIDPLGPDGDGRYLPSLWDPVRDRATRAPAESAPAGAVLVLDGTLLLGRWLDLDLTVHLALRSAGLARRTPPAERWTLPAYARYSDEIGPEEDADVVVRVDDPRRPAVVLR